MKLGGKTTAAPMMGVAEYLVIGGVLTALAAIGLATAQSGLATLRLWY